MRIYPELLVDQEFKTLGDQGFSGTLNDRQFAFLRSKGYVNALPDMMTSWLSYSPAILFSRNEPGIWLDPSDLTTMFQDRAGSTAVTTPGQSVGLRLDKSKGLVLGAELRGGGVVSTTGSPGTLATFNTSTGAGSAYRLDGSNVSGVQVPVADGRTYLLDVEQLTGTLQIRGTGVAGNQLVTSVVGRQTYRLSVATGEDFFFVTGTNAASVTFTVHSVKELPGFHAVANSDAARGIYGIEPVGGRRNLLTFTEQFDNAAWLKQNAGTGLAPVVTANAATAPDGTTTADLVAFNRGAGNLVADRSVLVQAPSGITSNTYVGSIWLKAATSGDIGKQIGIRTVGGTNYGVVTLTADWERVTRVETGSTANFELASRGTITVDNQVSVHVWGAQLETGSTATAYQRVTTQYDVTEAGKQTLHYVQYDGSDDGYVTPTITPGIDKVQVFAGVRKLSDAAIGVLLEHSASWVANVGSFILTAPGVISPNGDYNSGARGNFTVNANQGTSTGTIAAPATNVITVTHDIAGDLTTIRSNGTQLGTATGDKGTGNFLAYPLYIGRRGGTTLPFNGRDYGIITRFGANLDASTIAATESWLNQKTGAF